MPGRAVRSARLLLQLTCAVGDNGTGIGLGLQDLDYNAFTAGRSMDELFTLMAAAFVIYLLLTGVSDVALWALEKRYSHGVVKACPMAPSSLISRSSLTRSPPP